MYCSIDCAKICDLPHFYSPIQEYYLSHQSSFTREIAYGGQKLIVYLR